jgi:hypothetical protein
MHNTRPNVDCKTLLVAVIRCSNEGFFFWPNMSVVAVENPLPGEAGLIREQRHCG